MDPLISFCSTNPTRNTRQEWLNFTARSWPRARKEKPGRYLGAPPQERLISTSVQKLSGSESELVLLELPKDESPCIHAQSYGPASHQSSWSACVEMSCTSSCSLRKVTPCALNHGAGRMQSSNAHLATSSTAETQMGISTGASLQPVKEQHRLHQDSQPEYAAGQDSPR